MSNVIDQSGLLAISTRLQRLSDMLRKDGQKIYASYGIDFEPKWFPVIYTLHQKHPLSVLEIATEIGYSHPSTISLLRELEKKKLIRSKRDKEDERKRLLILTEKGRLLINQMQPVWQTMVAALTALTNTENNLMNAIDEVEQQMNVQSFYQRAQSIKNTSDNH
ncbi:MarR family transcriptional regulator [Olivibacter sp. SDN3]|uniref:MarR family winged helix-turn-helix transcriptional regulator n=1 Tax=Olivibacter sp. SDN3 TaxID=2764720 RepID=UPI001650F163|nr:MarR family transcriptional regulator [Olivibacter sp. SDN3]QNL50509.1 MarR family transcriptional regulator [Olivibacter sp. SDN3]